MAEIPRLRRGLGTGASDDGSFAARLNRQRGRLVRAPGGFGGNSRSRRGRQQAGTVPFEALERGHGALADELRSAFDHVVQNSSFILGEEVALFESEFANYCGVRHSVGVASGTAALTIALIAAGVRPGDEVIVPAHTHISTALAVVHAGATVVFCDVAPVTGLIDVQAAEAAVGPSTVAIIPVHLYGQACDMDGVCTLARKHQLLVIEDAAQAHGATFRGRPVGGLGDVAAFSFYPSSNLGALGDAGAVCTDDPDIAERARQLRDLGRRRQDEHVVPGYSDRMDGLQAALLRVKLAHLDEGNRARRAHAARYRQTLARELLLTECPDTPCVYQRFPILVADRDEIAALLARAGIATGVHYSRIAADHSLWSGHPQTQGDLAAARYWAAHELSLPMFPELTTEEIDRVLGACADLGYADSIEA